MKSSLYSLSPFFPLFLLLSDSCGFVDVGLSLCRDDGSVVYNFFAAGPRQYCHFRVRLPWDSRPYLMSQIPDFPFRRLLRLARLRWRYSTPPPHGTLCLFYLSPLKYSVCVWNRRRLSRLHFPLLRFHNNLVT
jgi:hypothetical protein